MPDETSPPVAPSAEAELWRGHTSQWVHFWYYFFCLLLVGAAVAVMPFTGGISGAAVIIPLCMWMVRWWLTRSTTYELTSQRLKIYRGILSRRLEEIELFRVKDYVMVQPLLLRLLGLGNLSVVSSDSTTPRVELRAIPGVAEVREQFRTAVQSERDRKHVRELDVDNLSPPEGAG
jgi:uncharacterized membrane protein YdbT with pleckstrin-like domain